MDHLWTPWRYAYVTATDGAPRPGVPASLSLVARRPGLRLLQSHRLHRPRYCKRHETGTKLKPLAGLILRGKHCFICLNAFPYTAGHVMVMPYAHLDRLAALPTETAHELMDLAQQTEQVLQRLYSPHGFNFGLNIGKAGGAGVAGHLHMHALPRWAGDTNFMTTVSETRILPEDLEITWKRMREAFAELGRWGEAIMPGPEGLSIEPPHSGA
jgi:ATP adenylyltransferase